MFFTVSIASGKVTNREQKSSLAIPLLRVANAKSFSRAHLDFTQMF
jgi:hypothetical protein